MSASQYFSAGRQTDAAANTVLADTGALNSGGILGANYEVAVLLNGSSAMSYKLETLDEVSSIVNTIWLTCPANEAKLVDPRATFFIPNGYSIRVRNDIAGTGGATHQAAILIKELELIDA